MSEIVLSIGNVSTLRSHVALLAVLPALWSVCLPAVSNAASAPIVESESVSGLTERGATLEARLNPGVLETTYSFWIGHDVCASPVIGYEKQCHFEVVGPLGEGHLFSGDSGQTVSTVVTGLEANETYVYLVVAVNSAGHAAGTEEQFRTLATQGSPSGGPVLVPLPGNPAESFERRTEAWVGSNAGEGVAREQAAANREKEEREAATRREQPTVPPVPAETTTPEAGEVSLVDSTIAVQRDGAALVKLDCTHRESCTGKLTITVTSAIGAHRESRRLGGKVKDVGYGKPAAKRPGGRTHKVAIATHQFSIPRDTLTTVKLVLNGTGRALLNANHGRLSARLVIVRFELGLAWTLIEGVWLESAPAHLRAL